MTRSRRRKLARLQASRSVQIAVKPRAGVVRRRLLGMMPALLTGVPAGLAIAQNPGSLDEIIVTVQKREENLQSVPASVQALSTAKLEQLNLASFDQYTQFLPSVSFVNIRPGFAQVYFRGVASAGDADANHSGSLPLVGTYLDEQPITTIQGALDVHLYDIQRIEALAGPQGTLYGASSEAGTIKIVTNKPNTDGFAAGYGVEGNTFTNGDPGYVAEGFVNAPLSDAMAIRLVGWAKRDGGFIDNVRRQRTFESTLSGGRSPITTDNIAAVEDDYNEANTIGARAALRIDLNDSWTVTPALMAQRQEVDGNFGSDNTIGEFKVAQRFPEDSDDKWWQAALTVEGRVANFDIVYAASYLDRDVDINADYSDYSYWYDQAYLGNDPNEDNLACPDSPASDFECFSDYFSNDNGDPIDFSQYIRGSDGYKKQSHELRISTPKDLPVRGIGGLFYQKQNHDIVQNYLINDLASSLSVTGREDTLWLTDQEREDTDYAVFGEVYWDVTEKLTATAGLRWFKAENSLFGYFGFGQGFSNSGNSGEARCDDLFGDGRNTGNPGADLPDYRSAPCVNLDAKTDDDDLIKKANLSYKITDDHLVYVTYAEGFRPGGINRRGTIPPYKPDDLNTYEVGWKTSWLDDRLRFNGAVFHQEWQDFQYSILGANGLTEVSNAADADIDGIEMDVNWAVGGGLGLSAGVAFLNAETTNPYCQNLDPGGNVVNANPCPIDDGSGGTAFEPPAAPSGTKLPVAPDFKGNFTARYEFQVGSLDAHMQGALVYVGKRRSDLRDFENAIVGNLPSYQLVDLTAGVGRENWSLELVVKNAFGEYAEFSRFAQCAEAVCGAQTYSVTAPPRQIGLKFSQEF